MDKERLARNLAEVQRRIDAAALRVGRDPASVTLVAVTKTVDVPVMRMLLELGVRAFGENRVPLFQEKVAALAGAPVEWHFIGHLQRNKAAKVLVPPAPVLHSLESLQLAEMLQKHARKNGLEIDAFVEVNVAGEESKYGLSPADTLSFVQALREYSAIRVRGLMTMAPWSDTAEEARPVFRALRELRDRLATETGKPLAGLSMGMSGDFDVAVEEGATHVRVGSALFA